MRAPVGTPVLAMTDGVVSKVQTEDLYKTEKLYKKGRAKKTVDRPDLEYSDSLFEKLRRLRLDISKKEKVKNYQN